MNTDIPILELPTWATQNEGLISVPTFDQALEVLEYIPEELDDLFSIDIADKAQSREAHETIALAKALGLL